MKSVCIRIYLVLILNSLLIHYKYTRQKSVTRSTAEAEYVAPLRKFLGELRYLQSEPTKIYGDNQSWIAMVTNPVHHERVQPSASSQERVEDRILSDERDGGRLVNKATGKTAFEHLRSQ
ncbi:hypothetical protein V1508DRAFT_422442 [Lipomyces doorenjongii]|uniref:uncharacterized protein n=1 Tax=Lipomyces doorenjongii TaxID=383834 RepID=UPI0034CD7B3D